MPCKRKKSQLEQEKVRNLLSDTVKRKREEAKQRKENKYPEPGLERNETLQRRECKKQTEDVNTFQREEAKQRKEREYSELKLDSNETIQRHESKKQTEDVNTLQRKGAKQQKEREYSEPGLKRNETIQRHESKKQTEDVNTLQREEAKQREENKYSEPGLVTNETIQRHESKKQNEDINTLQREDAKQRKEREYSEPGLERNETIQRHECKKQTEDVNTLQREEAKQRKEREYSELGLDSKETIQRYESKKQTEDVNTLQREEATQREENKFSEPGLVTNETIQRHESKKQTEDVNTHQREEAKQRKEREYSELKLDRNETIQRHKGKKQTEDVNTNQREEAKQRKEREYSELGLDSNETIQRHESKKQTEDVNTLQREEATQRNERDYSELGLDSNETIQRHESKKQTEDVNTLQREKAKQRKEREYSELGLDSNETIQRHESKKQTEDVNTLQREEAKQRKEREYSELGLDSNETIQRHESKKQTEDVNTLQREEAKQRKEREYSEPGLERNETIQRHECKKQTEDVNTLQREESKQREENKYSEPGLVTNETIQSHESKKQPEDVNTLQREELIESNEVMEMNEVDNCYQFSISEGKWSEIKPALKKYGGRGRERCRMTGGWTHMFSQKVSDRFPGCTLRFKDHNVKHPRSRKTISQFMTAVAICSSHNCGGKFKFYIETEPIADENVIVYYTVSGVARHDGSEVNRRNVAGTQRAEVAKLITETSSAETYYDNLIRAPKEQMERGNFTQVPTQAVLRKIVSEVVKKECLHSNVLAELEVLQESYGDDKYIQDIGMNPFTVILFSKKQVQLVKKLSQQKSLDIYVDSTGSVIHNIQGQKRPYLYSIVVRPREDLPPVSVADMVTTQHTIPRIELFLATLRRAVATEGTLMRVRKVETDYSLAIIQACLRQLSCCTLKTFLLKSFKMCCGHAADQDFTVFHLCAAHMLNNYIRSLKSLKVSLNKAARHVMLQAFVSLQNSSSLEEAKNIYEDICTIALGKELNHETELAKARLTQNEHPMVREDESGKEEEITEKLSGEDIEILTIKEASPFTPIFIKIRQDTEESVKDTEDDKNSNDKTKHGTYDYHCPEILKLLEDKFIPIIPMWSGMLLKFAKQEDGFVCTRDTNVFAENWFKHIKQDRKMMRLRPAMFVIKLKTSVEGRLAEQVFPDARKPKRKRKAPTETTLDVEEEVWKKKQKRTKPPKYQPKEKHVRVKDTLPPVMKWGGQEEGIHLSNTCTIDNGLTIIHLFSLQQSEFLPILQQQSAEVFKTLASVLILMNEGEFTAAKLIWLQQIKDQLNRTEDLLGDEYDKLFHQICLQLTSKTKSSCNQKDCPNQITESAEERGGISVGMTDKFSHTQTLVDKWLEEYVPCNESTRQLEDEEDEGLCRGRRCNRRNVGTSPILIVRVFEHCLYDNFNYKDILNSDTVFTNNRMYKLAGMTLHKSTHYCAICVHKGRAYWYDGLVGRLSNLPKDDIIQQWFPSHVIYCTS